MIPNQNLRDFKTQRYSTRLPKEVKFSGLDIKTMTIKSLSNEMNINISKSIFDKIFNTGDFDFLDLRGVGSILNDRDTLERLVDKIIHGCFKNLVASSFVVSQLQDSFRFHTHVVNKIAQTSALPNLVGKIGHVNVWMDPLLKFGDWRIALFNDVFVNFDRIELSENENNFDDSSNINLLMSYDFHVSSSKLIFIIENETSDTYLKYKSLIRDKKIDDILDGKEINN